jgi:hypothetical protein
MAVPKQWLLGAWQYLWFGPLIFSYSGYDSYCTNGSYASLENAISTSSKALQVLQLSGTIRNKVNSLVCCVMISSNNSEFNFHPRRWRETIWHNTLSMRDTIRRFLNKKFNLVLKLSRRYILIILSYRDDSCSTTKLQGIILWDTIFGHSAVRSKVQHLRYTGLNMT